MPYHDSTELPDDPAIKIFLQGQLILQPLEDFICDIGVNRCATNHQFSFELRQRMVDYTIPDVVIMRILGKIEPPGVTIDLEPESEAGVKRFVPTEEFARDDDDADPQDFRWLVDLSGEEFHNANVVINGNDTQPAITIMDGIFYTAQRTDPDVVEIKRRGGATGRSVAKDEVVLNRIASMMGVNIYLPDDGSAKFKLSWMQNGEEKEIVLDKPTEESGISHYEIRIINDPPFIATDELPSHRELREYYKAIDGVFIRRSATNLEQTTFQPFELEFGKGVTPPLGSPTFPCMPVGGGSGGGTEGGGN